MHVFGRGPGARDRQANVQADAVSPANLPQPSRGQMPFVAVSALAWLDEERARRGEASLLSSLLGPLAPQLVSGQIQQRWRRHLHDPTIFPHTPSRAVLRKWTAQFSMLAGPCCTPERQGSNNPSKADLDKVLDPYGDGLGHAVWGSARNPGPTHQLKTHHRIQSARA